MKIDDKNRDEKLQYDVDREAAKISALSSVKIDRYEYLTGKKILPSDQETEIEQAKFTFSPFAKPLEKQAKTIEQKRKQIDASTNPNEKLGRWTNKDDHQDNYKNIFEELVKIFFDKIKELTDETNHNNLTYYLKDNAIKEVCDDFHNGIELF